MRLVGLLCYEFAQLVDMQGCEPTGPCASRAQHAVRGTSIHLQRYRAEEHCCQERTNQEQQQREEQLNRRRLRLECHAGIAKEEGKGNVDPTDVTRRALRGK